MENRDSPERTPPVQFVRGSRAFRQFKNPPQPHMCIQDTIKDSTEKLYINVLGWQKIANPKHYSDPIPLYGGMQVTQGCGPNSQRTPLLVFAVMVNPDILKANGKNAPNPTDREALVSLLCDFVEAMNPGLALARKPVILKDRDLAGELKDVWLAVQNKREREKGLTQDVMYKVYDIDGIGNEELNEEGKPNGPRNGRPEDGSPQKTSNDKKNKSSKQILTITGQREYESGTNNTQVIQNVSRDFKATSADTSYCSQVYGHRDGGHQMSDIQQKITTEHTKPSTSFRKEWNTVHGKTTEGWDEFSKRNISTINTETEPKDNRLKEMNGKHYDFFPVFDNKTAGDVSPVEKNDVDGSNIIVDPMQKLVLHATDNKICDNKSSVSSLST